MTPHLIAATLGLTLGLGVQAQQAAGAPPSTSGAEIIAPLLDNDGVPLLPVPRAIPDKPENRTRSGLYVTEAQALAHERMLPGNVISLRVRCCGEQAIEDALTGVRAAPHDRPVLVRGDDLHLAARLADRLDEAGFNPVFVVTAP
ncbi:MAG: hypothetical protein QM674_15585 [Burkholderiaceae bacterium]